jgi:hypothetical protein
MTDSFYAQAPQSGYSVESGSVGTPGLTPGDRLPRPSVHPHPPFTGAGRLPA